MSRYILLAAALSIAAPVTATGQEEASPAASSPAGRPNVLFIAIDDLNDWVGFLDGHPQVQTPNMDRLAKRGMVFAAAQCAAPLCCPSRAAVFSGKQPFNTGVYHNGPNIRKLHPDLVLLPQYFAEHGYRSYGTGKLLHHNSPEIFDESFETQQRWSPLPSTQAANYTPEEVKTKATDPRHVVTYGSANRQATIPLNRMPSDRNPDGIGGESFDWGAWDVSDDEMGDGKITTWAIRELQDHPAAEPFLMCVGYYRPHIPLWAPSKYFEPYPEASIILPEVLASDLDDLSPIARQWAVEPVTAGAHKTVVEHDQWRAAVAAYLACVTFVDAQIGRLLDALETSPMAGNTAVVVWSDHGWHLGEKEHWGKWTGWERSTRVPLLIVPPSTDEELTRGGVCEHPVSLIDLYPTLVEMCGLPAKEGLDGVSLLPQLQDPSAETRPIITTFDRGNYSVRTDRWRFIHYADGSEELYDLSADPHEWHNLAGDPKFQDVQRKLRSELPDDPAPRLGDDR